MSRHSYFVIHFTTHVYFLFLFPPDFIYLSIFSYFVTTEGPGTQWLEDGECPQNIYIYIYIHTPSWDTYANINGLPFRMHRAEQPSFDVKYAVPLSPSPQLRAVLSSWTERGEQRFHRIQLVQYVIVVCIWLITWNLFEVNIELLRNFILFNFVPYLLLTLRTSLCCMFVN